MILGLMSDIHGNTTALRAVIDDATTQGVDRWWILGDIAAMGPDPGGVLEIIAGLTKAEVIGGNTDRYLVTGDRPYPNVDNVRSDPRLLERLIEVEASLSWTRGIITHAGWYDWIANLPTELRLTLPDNTRVLGIHASPRSDDGPGIDTRISDDDLAVLLEGCNADLVFGGHTHDVTDRTINGVRAVNLGSVSNPNRPDRAATYAILRHDDGHTVEHRIVDYDHHAQLAAIDRVHHPAADYQRRFHQ